MQGRALTLNQRITEITEWFGWGGTFKIIKFQHISTFPWCSLEPFGTTWEAIIRRGESCSPGMNGDHSAQGRARLDPHGLGLTCTEPGDGEALGEGGSFPGGVWKERVTPALFLKEMSQRPSPASCKGHCQRSAAARGGLAARRGGKCLLPKA